jgi:hypothetical protein
MKICEIKYLLQEGKNNYGLNDKRKRIMEVDINLDIIRETRRGVD